MGKLHVFFVSNGTIKVKILENDQVKPITHAANLKKMFPDIDIKNLQLVFSEQFGVFLVNFFNQVVSYLFIPVFFSFLMIFHSLIG